MKVKLYVVSISKPIETSTDYSVQLRLIDTEYVAPSGIVAPTGPMYPPYNPGGYANGVIAEFTKIVSANNADEWAMAVGTHSAEVLFTF